MNVLLGLSISSVIQLGALDALIAAFRSNHTKDIHFNLPMKQTDINKSIQDKNILIPEPEY